MSMMRLKAKIKLSNEWQEFGEKQSFFANKVELEPVRYFGSMT